MKNNNFWKRWKNKTRIEERAIESVKKAMKLLKDNLSREELISVYIKGSFVTREMNKKSDVDILPIVKDKSVIKKLKKVRDKNKEILRPSELLPISYTELKKNNREWGRADTFLRDIEHHQRVYGKKLIKEDYPARKWEGMFNDELVMIRDKSVLMHKEGKYGFSQLIKQVFWLVYSEQVMLGKNPPRTWKGLNKFIKEKERIIHKAYYFRKHPTKEKKPRKEFVKNLERYLKKITKRYQKEGMVQ